MTRKADHWVDARGHKCPVPTLRLRRALESAQVGEIVALIADDPLARIDVPHLATSLRSPVLDILDENNELTFWIQKS